ncbi:MAG TPA: glycosyl transferase, partial [Micromonosporaceae bacterium]|nr:glycosyl transferase [Micromonosporaceae bacterium]
GSRPYIGGSQGNSVLELALGYNGLGRLTGDEVGSVGGGGGANGGRWGETGILRMFNDSYGGQASWLLPAALILLAVGLWATRRRKRTDPLRAGFVLWGGWLLTTALVFSLMQGIIHEYYTVALAPAIGALIGAGAVLLWRVRRLPWARVVTAVTLAVTGWWAYVLLGRATTFLPWLRWTVLIGALAVACAMLASRLVPRWTQRTVALAGLVIALAGPAAFGFQTAATAYGGAIVTAGPASANGRGGPGGTPPGGLQRQAGQNPDGAVRPDGSTSQTPLSGAGQAPPGGAAMGGQRGGAGGLLTATTPNEQLKTVLSADADRYTWVLATVGANNAAGYQLALQRPVMAIGGFNGSDDAPSLAQFQQWVGEGKVHYFLGGGGFQANGGSNVSRQIAAWVAANFQAQTVGGIALYDLTAGAQ